MGLGLGLATFGTNTHTYQCNVGGVGGEVGEVVVANALLCKPSQYMANTHLVILPKRANDSIPKRKIKTDLPAQPGRGIQMAFSYLISTHYSTIYYTQKKLNQRKFNLISGDGKLARLSSSYHQYMDVADATDWNGTKTCHMHTVNRNPIHLSSAKVRRVLCSSNIIFSIKNYLIIV